MKQQRKHQQATVTGVVLFLGPSQKIFGSILIMKIPSSKVLGFLSLFGFLTGIAHSWESTNVNESPPFSEVFPSWNDVVSMAHLSHLVYDFRSVVDFTCANFTSFATKNETNDLSCHWYTHDYNLGTQVLLVSNKKEKYIAVVFAGTDDIRTSLEDTNILTKQFGIVKKI